MNKIDLVNKFGDKENLLSYYLPFMKYHGRLSLFKNGLDYFMLRFNGKSLLKGVTGETYAENLSVIEIDNPDEKSNLNPKLEKELRSFLDFCKDNVNTKLLFVRFPHAVINEDSKKRIAKSNTCAEIIKEYGYDCLEFETKADEIGLDFSKDFYNTDHMNVRGQQKFTSYLGKIICDKEGITPRKLSDKQIKDWNKSAEYTKEYYNFAESCIDSQNKLWLFENIETIKQIATR